MSFATFFLLHGEVRGELFCIVWQVSGELFCIVWAGIWWTIRRSTAYIKLAKSSRSSSSSIHLKRSSAQTKSATVWHGLCNYFQDPTLSSALSALLKVRFRKFSMYHTYLRTGLVYTGIQMFRREPFSCGLFVMVFLVAVIVVTVPVPDWLYRRSNFYKIEKPCETFQMSRFTFYEAHVGITLNHNNYYQDNTRERPPPGSRSSRVIGVITRQVQKVHLKTLMQT